MDDGEDRRAGRLVRALGAAVAVTTVVIVCLMLTGHLQLPRNVLLIALGGCAVAFGVLYFFLPSASREVLQENTLKANAVGERQFAVLHLLGGLLVLFGALFMPASPKRWLIFFAAAGVVVWKALVLYRLR